ncbi:hypothetical protein GQ43DRAFT_381093 [Delitschia confertaspora ATCC 74209]|uniref:Transposase Tc1-like domain-containing protein n=1 Tax=Delitschia confertaspora ATCC 74209 TaxID=1513339 RepID=A0A9P4MNR2_9PLEO|nr:hypothetical protein GQ43DRAFT_381093 [Delitschia confertaspora ATCC 74209]
MSQSFGAETSVNRQRRGELTPDQRLASLAKSKAGTTQQELADEFNCTMRCIRNTIKCSKDHKSTESLQISGRPQKYNHRERRAIIFTAHRTSKATYARLKRDTDTKHVHNSTIYRILKEQVLINHHCKRELKLNASPCTCT